MYVYDPLHSHLRVLASTQTSHLVHASDTDQMEAYVGLMDPERLCQSGVSFLLIGINSLFLTKITILLIESH